MIEKQKVTESVTREVMTAIVCDRCKVRIEADDIMQVQETHRFRFAGGYGSKFGDGNRFECELCDQCCLEMFKPFMRQVFEEGALGEAESGLEMMENHA